MRCIAIDDEPIALSIIQSFCQRMGDIELEIYSNPIEGIEAIQTAPPEIILLDIEMNDLSGLDLARQLPDDCILIFTTAHANYALDGYDLNAVDFLHKPFSYDRFTVAISRAIHIVELRNKAKTSDNPSDSHLVLKVEYQNVTIPTSDILYIEAMDNYIKVHTCDNRRILTQMTLKSVLELLPKGEFLRIHRSFIVSKTKIDSFTKRQVKLLAFKSITLPIGRIYAEGVYTIMLSAKP